MTTPLSSLAVALALVTPFAVAAQTSPTLQLLSHASNVPMLTYTMAGRMTAVPPSDVFEIEISDSGGITDIFIRLAPAASVRLAEWTTLAVGMPMTVRLCGALVRDSVLDRPVTSGTFYIPNLDAVQAEALRAVWQGRDTCSTLPPEVFPIGQ